MLIENSNSNTERSILCAHSAARSCLSPAPWSPQEQLWDQMFSSFIKQCWPASNAEQKNVEIAGGTKPLCDVSSGFTPDPAVCKCCTVRPGGCELEMNPKSKAQLHTPFSPQEKGEFLVLLNLVGVFSSNSVCFTLPVWLFGFKPHISMSWAKRVPAAVGSNKSLQISH